MTLVDLAFLVAIEIHEPLKNGAGQSAVIDKCREGLELLEEARTSPPPPSATAQAELSEAFDLLERGLDQHCLRRFAPEQLEAELREGYITVVAVYESNPPPTRARP